MSNSSSKRIFLSPPHMGGEELGFIQDAFESNYIAPLGPMVDAFEQEFTQYTGISHCVALSSGTAAMHLALKGLGIGPGDEVFASSLTFIGSVTPILFQGAIPVLIDSDRVSWNMDPELLERELERCKRMGRIPKAVVPTDLYGQCCYLPRILEICEQYGVPVVCDSAEAMGALFKRTEVRGLKSEDGDRRSDIWWHAGRGAKATVFSFNGNKVITTSGGGMLASDDMDFIEQARFLSQQARDVAPHYEHSQIGYNYRMSNILAAIGRGQLKVLDERVKRKRELFNFYKDALNGISGIEFMPEASYGKANRWLTVILITPEQFGADRETVRLALENENIEARPVWKPMHLQPVFTISHRDTETRRMLKGKRYKARMVGGEVAEDLFARGLCLPSGTAMTENDLNKVVSVIRRCYRGNGVK